MAEVTTKKEEPYVYTLKAILDMNEIYDSGDCDMIRCQSRKDSDQTVKYVDYEEYLKLQKRLEVCDHNAKVLLKVADNEIAKLKEIAYCHCDEPDAGDMDNSCAKCLKPIENHPLTVEMTELEKLSRNQGGQQRL